MNAELSRVKMKSNFRDPFGVLVDRDNSLRTTCFDSLSPNSERPFDPFALPQNLGNGLAAFAGIRETITDGLTPSKRLGHLPHPPKPHEDCKQSPLDHLGKKPPSALVRMTIGGVPSSIGMWFINICPSRTAKRTFAHGLRALNRSPG